VGLYRRVFLIPGLIHGVFLVSMTCGGRKHERDQDYIRFRHAALSCYFSFTAFIIRSFINVSFSTELFILNLGDFSPLFCDRSVPVYRKNGLLCVIFTYLKCRLYRVVGM